MNTTSVDQQLKQVLEKFHTGEFAVAAALVDATLAVFPGHPELLHLGATIALRRRRPDLAVDFARQAVAAERDNTTFKFTLAQALCALRRHDEAIVELRHILRIDPEYHMAHVQIWNIMKALGRRHELIGLVKARLAAIDAQRRAPPPATKVRIPDTTLCCIDCNNHAPAIRALRLSVAGCDFSRAVFFTDREFDLMPIETVIIDPLRSLPAYSEFVMKRLLHYVDTRYVLVIQWDGYVVNPGAWSAQFQRFDYIGARLPFLPAGRAVGNGGFSLRSRALLEVLQDPRFSVTHPEDLAVCQTYRHCLESEHGIRFAPDELADRFSFELDAPAGATFGFHGPRNITRFIDDAAIRLLQAE